MKNIFIWVLALIILAGGGYYFLKLRPQAPSATNDQQPQQVATTTEPATPTASNETVIGKSVQERDIIAYKYGSGEKKVLFVGGIHGGYEWNTALMAYQLVDYLKDNESTIPSGVEVTVIPVLNPDGLYKVVGSAGRFTAADVPASQATQVSGRFNANNVDLNRNFDCDWKPSGMWQNTAVDGGAAVFSEPEAAAMRDFIASYKPSAVVGIYSAAGGVYSSACGGSVSKETAALTSIYAKASGYPAHASFDNYAITGDMENWLAKIGTPAISVLLTDHQNTEWEKNLAGIKALLQHFAQ